MRTWICPDCKRTEEVSYDRLAEQGKPTCGHCQCEMELQPEADDLAAVVERLAEKAGAAGLEPEDLDEMVHESTSSIAADINNGGLEEQIKYLAKEMGAQNTERQLDKLIEERQGKEE